MAASPTPALSLRTLTGYGMGDFGFNLMFQFTGLYLLIFYTDIMGLDAATAGLIFIAARVWDGINDPIMGWLAERNRSRWGKYRPFLLWGAAPLGFCLLLLFWESGLPEDWRLAYAVITYLAFGMAFTALNIPFGALTAAITRDYHERSRLTGWRMTLGIVGGMVAASFAHPLITWMGGDKQGYFLTAALFAVIATVCIWFCFFQVKERYAPGRPPVSLSQALEVLRNNRPFWTLTFAFFFNFATLSLISGMIPYFFEYYLGDKEGQSLGLTLMFGAAAASVPAWTWLSGKVGKRNVYLLGGGIYFLALLSLYAATGPLLYLVFALLGTGAGSSAFTGWAMLPDTVEYAQARTGIRAESSLYGVYGFFFKAGIGTGIWLAGMGLSLAGYEPNSIQSPQAAEGIRLLSSLLPAGLIALSLLILGFYTLSSRRHKALSESLS